MKDSSVLSPSVNHFLLHNVLSCFWGKIDSRNGVVIEFRTTEMPSCLCLGCASGLCVGPGHLTVLVILQTPFKTGGAPPVSLLWGLAKKKKILSYYSLMPRNAEPVLQIFPSLFALHYFKNAFEELV